MDLPLAIHVDAQGLETLPPEAARLDLKARSLRNTLGVLKRRLLALRKDSAHTRADVEHYKYVLQYVLDHLDERWRDDAGTFAGALAATDPGLAGQCSRLWTVCYDLVAGMEREVAEMPAEVQKVHERLADLHHRLRELLEREHTTQDVDSLGGELNEIEAQRRVRGSVFGGDLEAPAPGNAACAELLSHNFELLRECAHTAHDVPPALRTVEAKLRRIQNSLRRLAGRKHHTAADVRHYEFLLGAIASTQAEYHAEWEGSAARRLLEECLEAVRELEATAEEMPPKVAEVHSQLQLLRAELDALASSKEGPPPTDQLQRAQRALDTIDDDRAAHGGVFGGSGGEAGGEKAPPGQAVCAHLLDRCYRVLHELQERAKATGGASP